MNSLTNRTSRMMIALLFLIGIVLLHAPQSFAAGELADGEYTIDFEILKGDPKDDSTSLANGYWNKPATLIIKNSKISVRTVINKDAWVTEFSTKQGSSFTETKVISRNTDKDTRLVEFKISSLSEDLVATMSVDIPSQNYYHSYETRFRFYPDTITTVKLDEPTATEAPASSANDSSKITKEEKATAGSTSADDRASSSQSSKQDAAATKKPTSGSTAASDGGSTTANSNTSKSSSNDAAESKSNSSSAGKEATTSVESGNIGGGSSGSSSAANDSSAITSSSDTVSKDSSAKNDASAPETETTSEVVNAGDTLLSEEAVQPIQSGASQLVEESASAEDVSQLLASSDVDVENTSAAVLHSEEDQQGGKVTIAIIIIIGVLFVVGSIIWIVRNRKKS
ncbi:NEAT domain-containing protein [Paenibacillus camelliae]|uniref:NEAT domain-containing protein n=1 Tax=Paenibacillus camelliae TaxID=512410 RepID=UPI00203DFFE0|nr:NEAT domain-containing protein [Paenibacillus camelliae]MCM3633829.1 NEAT domain-containing protein [Paenibacillus camelliae]